MGSLLRAALGPKPGHPWSAWGYYDDQAMALLDLLDHLVKESHRRVSIGREVRLVYIQSIYVPSLWVWDRRYVQWKLVVQMSGK